MSWELVDMEMRQIKFRVNDEQVSFNMYQSIWQPKDMQVVSVIDIIDDDALTFPIQKRLGVEALEAVIINFNSDGISKYDEIVSTLYGRGPYLYALKKLDLNLKNRDTPPA